MLSHHEGSKKHRWVISKGQKNIYPKAREIFGGWWSVTNKKCWVIMRGQRNIDESSPKVKKTFIQKLEKSSVVDGQWLTKSVESSWGVKETSMSYPQRSKKHLEPKNRESLLESSTARLTKVKRTFRVSGVKKHSERLSAWRQCWNGNLINISILPHVLSIIPYVLKLIRYSAYNSFE